MRKFLAAMLALLALAFTGAAMAAHSSHGTEFTVPLVGHGGTGTAVIVLSPAHERVCYRIEVVLSTHGDRPQEPAPGLGAAHIHVLPSGAIVVDLEAQFVETGPSTFRASGCVAASRDVILAILADPGSYYVNVHTAAFPGGAVTGTLG